MVLGKGTLQPVELYSVLQVPNFVSCHRAEGRFGDAAVLEPLLQEVTPHPNSVTPVSLVGSPAWTSVVS